MSEDKILRLLRCQAWERAKGELQSMYHSYYSVTDETTYEDFVREVESFIKKVEDNGLHE